MSSSYLVATEVRSIKMVKKEVAFSDDESLGVWCMDP